ncbi:MAG: response regulator [Candidatus Binataceae bacterium]
MSVRTLIVDDSPLSRKMIRHHLERFGCVVVAEAESPAQALKLFREHKPNLVSLDVMMPQVGGVDSATAFRAMRKESPDTAIVVVSVLPFVKTRDAFLKEGALAYVVKPFNAMSVEQIRLKLVRAFPELADQIAYG